MTGPLGLGTGAGQLDQPSTGGSPWQSLEATPSLRGEKLTGVAPLADDRLILTAMNGRMAVLKLDLIGGKTPPEFDRLVTELGDSGL